MTTKPSANELRALVAELKPRSPQEVMGAAASSNLMASMLTATLTATALVVGATVLMFSLGFGPTASQETVQANANQSDATIRIGNNNLPKMGASWRPAEITVPKRESLCPPQKPLRLWLRSFVNLHACSHLQGRQTSTCA